MSDHIREAVSFETAPGVSAFGYLLIPKDRSGPTASVICSPGHGKGVDALVGIADEPYQNQNALQCVRAGFVTLALEPINFGHRKSQAAADKDSSCHRDATAALMLGETMIGWRVHDCMRAIDYLQARPEVDPSKIWTLGISGGGLISFWTACLDERVAGTVVSGYFNTFFDSILAIDHCIDNFAPGLARIVEMPDMTALVAPRPMFAESG